MKRRAFDYAAYDKIRRAGYGERYVFLGEAKQELEL